MSFHQPVCRNVLSNYCGATSFHFADSSEEYKAFCLQKRTALTFFARPKSIASEQTLTLRIWQFEAFLPNLHAFFGTAPSISSPYPIALYWTALEGLTVQSMGFSPCSGALFHWSICSIFPAKVLFFSDSLLQYRSQSTNLIVIMTGKLNLIIGPMFSGKSTILLTRYRRYQIAGKRCLLIKYANDQRYDGSEAMLVTHDQISYRATSCHCLAEVTALVQNYDVICVDEIQFYPDASHFCDAWANAGKIVEVCGLSGDYRRQPFEQISLLIPLADHISFVTAVCRDTGEEAPFSMRLSDEEQQEVIGSTDKYQAVSRMRYLEGQAAAAPVDVEQQAK